jgi:hypothetical protein
VARGETAPTTPPSITSAPFPSVPTNGRKPWMPMAQSNPAIQESLFCCGKMAQIPEHDGTFEVTCPDHHVRYTVIRETTGPSEVGVGVTGNLTFRRLK